LKLLLYFQQTITNSAVSINEEVIASHIADQLDVNAVEKNNTCNQPEDETTANEISFHNETEPFMNGTNGKYINERKIKTRENKLG